MHNLGRVIRCETLEDFDNLVEPALRSPEYNFSVALPGAVVRFRKQATIVIGGDPGHAERVRMTKELARGFLEKAKESVEGEVQE